MVHAVSGQVLSDVLAGKRVSVAAGESAYWRTFGGDQSPEDLETALQLVHRLFTTQARHSLFTLSHGLFTRPPKSEPRPARSKLDEITV